MALVDDKVEFIRKELEKQYGAAHANKGRERVSFFIPNEIIVNKTFIQNTMPWVVINQIIEHESLFKYR